MLYFTDKDGQITDHRHMECESCCDGIADFFNDKVEPMQRRIRRLRKLADGYRRLVVASGYVAMFRKQREIERARIVAMLRLAAENDPNARCSILDLADEIERGE